MPIPLLLILAAAPLHAQPGTRVSKAPVDARAAWTEFGFRLNLRLGYERLGERLPAPRLQAFDVVVEPAFRLSEHWSAGIGLRYGVVSGSARGQRWNGLRWTTTFDLTLHPLRPFSLTVGAGYGGLLLYRSYASLPNGAAATVDSKTSQLDQCDGDGVVGLARLGYLFVSGELFATGPVVQVDLQGTECRGTIYDTAGLPLRLQERWWQSSAQVSWAFAWR